MAAYWIISAAPILAVALLSLWPAFRHGYWDGVADWGPGLLAGGLFLAVDGVFSSAAGFWVFTPARFAPERYLGLPAAEWLFFVAAMFGVRLLWFISEWWPGEVRHPRAVALVWLAILGASLGFGLHHHDRARTVYVFALAAPVVLAVALASRAFFTRQIQFYLVLGFALFTPMDLLMNGLGSFAHNDTHRSTVELGFGTPVEDLPYMLFVLLLLRLLGELSLRSATLRRRSHPPAVAVDMP